jgi:hypothetical protein
MRIEGEGRVPDEVPAGDFKFRDRQHVIDKLVSEDCTAARERWAWIEFLDRLDKANLMIVEKPTLIDIGRGRVGP